MDGADPRQLLAQRLRALREERWPGIRITQPQLAQALGGVKPLSVPLISSWESQSNPRVPPFPRLEAYAALFATRRSFAGDTPCLIGLQDMTDEERHAMNELRQELTHLRNIALGAAHAAGGPAGGDSVAAARLGLVSESLSTGPWHFGDGKDITIVCAQWPPEMLTKIPYTDVRDPDYIDLLTFSDLDSLFELHGHLRAANPATEVLPVRADKIGPNAYSSHLVSLGGVDWNQATTSMLSELQLPIRQIADWKTQDGQFFEIEEKGRTVRYGPVLEQFDSQRKVLHQDVALFARAMNPFNHKRTVTICCGMYGRGTYGAVRALTDARYRDRNADYLLSRFGESDAYCMLTRVRIVNGVTITPDWTIDDNRLFEWSRPSNA